MTMLVGPVLVVGLSYRNGDSKGIPARVADMLLRSGSWRVEARVACDPK